MQWPWILAGVLIGTLSITPCFATLVMDWNERFRFRRESERPYKQQRYTRWLLYAVCLAVMAEPFVMSMFSIAQAVAIATPVASCIVDALICVMMFLVVQARYRTPEGIRRVLTVPGAILLDITGAVIITAWFTTGLFGWILCAPFALFFGTRRLYKETRASLKRVSALIPRNTY